MSLKERIDLAVEDINAQIAAVKAEKEEKLKALKDKKDLLLSVRPQATPELEQAVVALQKIGFLKGL